MKLKLPDFKKGQDFFSNFKPQEKILFLFLVLLTIASLFYLGRFFYIQNTVVVPAHGGTYREGVVGQPRFINPVYAPLNDPDKDLVELIFSGLTQYNQQGEVELDLAKDYSRNEEGTIYTFTLRENALWHDGEPVTSDDIIFTIQTLKNSDYDSPHRANWLGIKVEKVDSNQVRFLLGAPDISFLETLAQTKIIPKHVWKDTPAKTFSLAISSTQYLVGSGPFKFKKIEINENQQMESLELKDNPDYYFSDHPYLSEFHFKFFQTEEELKKAAQQNKIDGFALENFDKLENFSSWNVKEIQMPRYFSLFFNPQNSEFLTQKSFREALNYATDQQEIVNQAINSYGIPINSPVLPDFYNIPKVTSSEYNLDKANQILTKLGYQKKEGEEYRQQVIQVDSPEFTKDLQQGSQNDEVEDLQKCLSEKFPDLYPSKEVTGYFGPKTKAAVVKFQEKYFEEILEPWGFSQGTGLVSRTTRAKLNEVCTAPPKEGHYIEITLTTIDNPQLIEVANLIKEQWAKIGIRVIVISKPTAVLENEIISPRNYEMLLFGEMLNMNPDLYPFWHSSKKVSPGLNLALYNNEKADQLLEETHQALDIEIVKDKYAQLQTIILNDVPSIFLYRPFYLYLTRDKINTNKINKITEPARRFAKSENWYIDTGRAWK